MFGPRSIFRNLLLAGALLITCITAYGQMREFSNRNEGRRIVPNNLPDFTLMGLHKNFTSFGKKVNLKVRFFLPRLPNTARTSVEAVELKDSSHYYMRSKDSFPWKPGAWNIFEQWPTSDVIDDLGLSSDNLGVLAQYETSSTRRVYLPADVYQADNELTGNPYKFHFITGQDLQSLDIQVFDAGGNDVTKAQPQQANQRNPGNQRAPVRSKATIAVPKLKCNTTLNPNCKKFAAGSTNSFDLDFSSMPEGEYNVKLVGHIPGNLTPRAFDIIIYHHSQETNGR